ncbi:unnamed protein product [Vicia faba]|uniref:FBD domain-containing protein n=1 Tax=Vicia faba TaxID=3906 RepID=A0AAV0ZEG1_VICFA|nr:unnamed protein product [Vicia faba]
MVVSRTEIMADRISEFHDSILCHILSFLPTKHAATTSILSKRWKSLWLSVLTLDFDCESFKAMASFDYSVHKFMLLRNIGLPILSFRFNCTHCFCVCNKSDVTLFVSYLTNRGIENLNIKNNIILPPSILSCKTLKVLKLIGAIVNSFSHQVDFPVLKILHLKEMRFERHELLVKLLSGCATLEELQTKYLCVRYKDSLVSEKDSLVSEKEFDGLLPSLIKAKISFDNSIIPVNLVRNVENLCMKQVSLTYCTKHSMFHNLTPLTYCTKLPMFHNVTHVEFKIFGNMWDWLPQMLERCHKLQSLIIQGVEYQDELKDKSWEDPAIVPKCLSSQLRTCCLAYCKGTKNELQFAKYILQNSKVLKTMKIKYDYCADIQAKHQMTMELSSFAKGSTMCEPAKILIETKRKYCLYLTEFNVTF